MSSSKTAVPARPHLTSLMYSVPIRRLKVILSQLIPDATLGPVEELPSLQLARLYNLTMSDDRKLLLSFAPSLTVRLMRHEASIISSEATLVYFISGSSRESEASSSSQTQRQNPQSTELAGLVPKIVKHSSDPREMGYPYSIFEPVDGVPLSTLSLYLSLSERRLVDKQLGSITRSLASLTSPSGTFGTVSRVLPDPFKVPSANPETKGSQTWSEAFNILFEGILRDGEDMAVLLPYEVVRAHAQRLSWHLDSITLPRLVILDAGSEANIMIERRPEEDVYMTEEAAVKLKGFRSWCNGVFGDPLISNSFEEPSESFMEGWREAGEETIEDEGNVEVRILLYRCYRAVTSIVTEYYRPQSDSSRRELEGRRKLTSALAELEKIDAAVGDALKRERSLSKEKEAEASKRPKLDAEEL